MHCEALSAYPNSLNSIGSSFRSKLIDTSKNTITSSDHSTLKKRMLMINSTKISLFVLLFAATALHASQATKSLLPLSTYAKGQPIHVGNDGCVAIADPAEVHFVVDSYTTEQLPDGFIKKTVIASHPCMSIWG